MIQIDKKNISSNITRFRIIFEKTDNFDIAGTLYNDSYGIAIDFKGIRQMLSRLDVFFDYVNFPQATHKKRSFHSEAAKQGVQPPSGLREANEEELRGKKANLLLHVQFRQNSTWQGTLEFLTEKRIKRFRSELEMIEMILDSMKI